MSDLKPCARCIQRGAALLYHTLSTTIPSGYQEAHLAHLTARKYMEKNCSLTVRHNNLNPHCQTKATVNRPPLHRLSHFAALNLLHFLSCK